MDADINTTDDEELSIRALERLAKRWPKSLWLFAADGQLHVMKSDEAGGRALNDNNYDRAAIVCSVSIPADGGDW